MGFWLVGGKKVVLLSKKANIMGKGVEKREKGEIFTVHEGKRGVGKNIQFLGNIYPYFQENMQPVSTR